jgi:DNA-binding MarR family transcriptional regulator
MAGPAGLDEQPRWLTAGEQAAWRPIAGLLFRLPAALDQQLQRDAGVTHFEYMVLSSLSEAPGHTLRMSDLATMASGSLSRLSHVVSRLERRGWVRREPCPGDGRYINAVLTEEGWAKVVETAPGHVEAVRRLLIEALTPEQFHELGAASERVLKSLGLPATPELHYKTRQPPRPNKVLLERGEYAARSRRLDCGAFNWYKATVEQTSSKPHLSV